VIPERVSLAGQLWEKVVKSGAIEVTEKVLKAKPKTPEKDITPIKMTDWKKTRLR
jgi:hypothetical protein